MFLLLMKSFMMEVIIVSFLLKKNSCFKGAMSCIASCEVLLYPFVERKINYLRFLPKFNHRFIASQGFQISKDFCDISFRFQDIGITKVLIFFLTVHIFEFFSSAVFKVFKEIIIGNSNQFEFFYILHH